MRDTWQNVHDRGGVHLIGRALLMASLQFTRNNRETAASEHNCDLAPQNELKVAKYTLLVIPTEFV